MPTIAIIGDRFMLSDVFETAIRACCPVGELEIRKQDLPWPDVPMEHGYAEAGLEGLKEYLGEPDDIVAFVGDDENVYLDNHDWEAYGAWHLDLTEGANEETKARYAFVFGDFRRIHRSGIIACHYRAAEWRHKEIELAAHELLQYLDGQAGIGPRAHQGAAHR